MLGRALQPRLQASIYRRAKVAKSFSLPTSITNGDRFYSRTSGVLEDAAAISTDTTDPKEERLKAARIRQDYNNRRAAYKREVSKLRKEYAQEVAEQRAADEAAKAKKASEEKRLKLERLRKKNIRTGINLLRQEQLRKEQELVFAKHLAQEKVKREAREEQYREARQMAIDELVKDSHHWLSTPEEVDAAFTPEAIQRLWARPQGVIGSPNPSPDCHFWSMQTHTYKMTREPKTQRQYLLELVEERMYENSNLDMKYWTQERIQEVVQLEEKARLRADVQVVGRRELLKKQAQMLDSQYETKSGEIPKVRPPPSLQFLADVHALEKEGAEVLRADPTKFFEFDEYGSTAALGDEDASSDEDSMIAYGGPTLGKPIGLKKIGKNEFPISLGRTPKKDVRSDKEKKQAEREKKMFDAAQAKMVEDKGIDFIIEEEYGGSRKSGGDHDGYSPVAEAENKEWSKGLDPNNEIDRALLNVPPALRFPEEDIEWVYAELLRRQEYYERVLMNKVEQAQDQIKSSAEFEARSEEPEEGLGLEPILLDMPPKELLELSRLDEEYVLNPEMSAEMFSEAASKIPSLSEEQIQAILQRDRSDEES